MYQVVVALGFGFWIAGRGSESGWYVYRVEVASGFPSCRPGVKSGWYVPGCGCVGFLVAGRGSNRVGVNRVVVTLGVQL